jgi:hypothetical protein
MTMRKKRVLRNALITLVALLILTTQFAYAEPAESDTETTEEATTEETGETIEDDLKDIDLSNVPEIGAQGTDGDELTVTKTSSVEIYLGEDMAGLQFTLETDDGTYPETVTTDQSGWLTFEIATGDHYTLTSTGNYELSNSTQSGMVNADGTFDDPLAEEETTTKSHIPIWLIIIVIVGVIVFTTYTLMWLGIIQKGKRKRKPQKKDKPEKVKQEKTAEEDSDEL